METLYYALYRSSNVKTACRKQFLSVGHPTTYKFRPSVATDCELCHTNHAFAYTRVFMASTPSQRRALSEWCTRQGVEMEIVLDTIS